MPPAPKAWLDPRAALLALALAIAAGLPLATTSATRRDFYFFDVTLTSETPGLTRFLWDLGRGMNEADSSAQPLRIETKPVRYRFMVPPGEFRGFRLDPIDHPGRLTLSHARIVDRHGHLVREFQPAEFKAARDIAGLDQRAEELVFVTTAGATNPILELPLSAPLSLPVPSWARMGAMLPVALPVFLLGLLLSSPRLLEPLRSRSTAAARWLAARPRSTVMLAATLAVMGQAHPVIFGGRSFVSPNNGSYMLYGTHPTLPGATQAEFADTMGSDVGSILFNHLYYPMIEREAIFEHGELPLWNRYSLGGEPLLGQGQSMLGDPFNLITLLADGAAGAWDLRFLLAHWLLAAGLGLAAWMLTRHLPASVLVTLGAGFISYFTFRINHPANFSVCYAPWILVAWLGLLQSPTRRAEAGWLGGLLLANWTEFSSGTMKEASVLMACLDGAGVLLVLFIPATAGRRLRLLLLASAAGGVFLLLSAPLWISFLTALHHSITLYDLPQVQTYAPARVLGLFDDLFYRQMGPDEWVAGPGLNGLFLLGVLAWLVNPDAWRRDRAGLALLVAAAVAGSFAFGVIPNAIILRTPFLANIWHVGNTFSCPLLILLPLLAACGFRDAFTSASRPGWRKQFAAALLLLAALTVAFFVSARGHPKSVFFQGYAAALAVAVLGLALGLRATAQSGRPNALAVALVLGLPLLLWRHGEYLRSTFNHYAFTPGERVDFHAPSPAVAFVDREKGPAPSRVIGLQNNLFPDYHIALHWESLYGVDAVRNGYYLELTAAFHLDRVAAWGDGTPLEDGTRRHGAHDLLNVSHYLVDPQQSPREIPGLQWLAHRDLEIYGSPSVWPRAFFTDRMAVYGEAAQFVALAQTGDGRPFAAVQGSETDAPKLPADFTGRIVRPAMDYRLTSNTTTFVVDASGPGVAVLTETFYPEDFQATVDGRPARYFRVNHAFKGVFIDRPGRHEVAFAYWPQHFTLALALAAGGFFLLLAGGTALWCAGRKKNGIQGAVPA